MWQCSTYWCSIKCLQHTIWTWYPGVGWYIAILGALGVAVAILRDLTKISGREKACWIAVTFTLLLLELHSISLDKKAHDEEERESRERSEQHFQEIADGIEK